MQKFNLSFNISTLSLTCGTTYHYRAFATNDTGTGYGDDETFSTLSCVVPEVGTLDATNTNQSSADFKWIFLNFLSDV
ncbi:MAG: hypothetical protein R3B39_01985 [Candidatus Paceibacterota bacterium]